MVLQEIVDEGEVRLKTSGSHCPPFPKPCYVPGDVDGRDFWGVEEGDIAEIEEALQVGRVVLVRALGGSGLEQARSRFFKFVVPEHGLHSGRARSSPSFSCRSCRKV